MTSKTTTFDKVLGRIARQHLPGVETLETRGSDDLDFHDLSAASLKAALAAAYNAGRSEAGAPAIRHH